MKESKQRGDLVVVSVQPTVWQADLDVGLLRGEGIEAIVLGGDTATWLPHMSMALNARGIRVLVRPEDAEAAREVLARAEPLEESPAEASQAGPDGSPAGENELTEADRDLQGDEPQAEKAPAAPPAAESAVADYARRAFRAAVIMYVCLPLIVPAFWYLGRALWLAKSSAGVFVRYGAIALIALAGGLIVAAGWIDSPRLAIVAAADALAAVLAIVAATTAEARRVRWHMVGAFFFLFLPWAVFGLILATSNSWSWTWGPSRPYEPVQLP